MKKSLELLGVTSSGLKNPVFIQSYEKNDDELLVEAKKLNTSDLQKEFLRSFFKDKPHGFPKSKCYFAKLVSLKEPDYSCELIMSACQASPLDPWCYFTFSEVALSNNSFFVAQSALEIVQWLVEDTQADLIKKYAELKDLIEKKTASGEVDNSKSSIWSNKSPQKYWVLERLYFHSQIKELKKYAFKLLDMFPVKLELYDVVFRALMLIDDAGAIETFIEKVNNNLPESESSRALYLGMAYYALSDFFLSINNLVEAIKIDRKNFKAYLYLCLNYLMQNNLKDFSESFNKMLPGSDAQFTAVFFLYSAINRTSLGVQEFPNQKLVSHEIAKIFKKLIKEGQNEIINTLLLQFKSLNYYLILPLLPVYLTELFILQNNINTAKQIIAGYSEPEVYRLNAWIYRLEGNSALAEEELVKYRKFWIPEKSAGIHCKLVDLKTETVIPKEIEQIFTQLKSAYSETSKLTSQIELEYGLNPMTCVETGCQDCCKKTFPYASYTEYLYMYQWFCGQPDDVKKLIQEESKKIVSMYKEKYGKEPPFMSGETFELNKEYPVEFVFECPFLGDNKCNVYENRPFTCRAYAYSSQDGVRYKGCNYFFEQLKGATKLNDIRKVLNMRSFYDFAKKTDEQLIGKRVVAPLPVWFAQSYEETLEKIKNL